MMARTTAALGACLAAFLLSIQAGGQPRAAGGAPALAPAQEVPAAAGADAPARRVGNAMEASVSEGTEAFRPVLKDVPIQPAGMSDRDARRALDLAKQAGVSVVLIGVHWTSYEPDGQGVADRWDRLERFLDDLDARGMHARFQLSGLPDWARDPGRPSTAAARWLPPQSDAELARWSEFVARVGSRFGDRVPYYEIWNEPNEARFWPSGPSPTAYARLLAATYPVLRSHAPGSSVIFGGISRNDVGFLERTYDAIETLFPSRYISEHHFFDLLGVHPYSGDRGPTIVSEQHVHVDAFGVMDENFVGMARMRAAMVARGDAYKHIYIGEYGFSTRSWNGFAPVSDNERATYLRQAYDLAARLPYVDALGWFAFLETPWDGAQWAIVDRAWRPTATYHALAEAPGSG